MATAPKNKDKADYGTGRTPGHFCVIPQRAVADIRFKTYPRTFMVLCALGIIPQGKVSVGPTK